MGLKAVLQSPQQAAAGGQGGASPQQKDAAGTCPKEVKLPTFEQELLLPQNLTKLANNMQDEKSRSSFHEFLDFLKKSNHPIEIPDDVAKACFYGPYAHLAPVKGRGRGGAPNLESALGGPGGPDPNLLNLARALRGQLDDSDGLDGGLMPDSPDSPKQFSPSSRVYSAQGGAQNTGPVIEEVTDDAEEPVELILPPARKSGTLSADAAKDAVDAATTAKDGADSVGSSGKSLTGSTNSVTCSDTSEAAAEEGSDSAEGESPKGSPKVADNNPAAKSSANKKRKKR